MYLVKIPKTKYMHLFNRQIPKHSLFIYFKIYKLLFINIYIYTFIFSYSLK